MVPFVSRVSQVSVVEALVLGPTVAGFTASSRTRTSAGAPLSLMPLAITRAVIGPVTVPRVTEIATGIVATAPSAYNGEIVISTRPFGRFVGMMKTVGGRAVG